METLKKILNKWLCCHDWGRKDVIAHEDHANVIYACKRCGKIKIVRKV